MNLSSYQSQRGAATLILTVVLLALLTVTVLVVSQNVTVDLRSSSNANRDKEALAVAQAGVEYGAMRYLADNTITYDAVSVPSNGGVLSEYLVANTSGTLTVVASGGSADGTAFRQVWEDYDIFTVAEIGEIPPLMAGGEFPPTGSFSIVANPNGGGDGVPVSAWVKDTNPPTSGTNGSWQTCGLDEYVSTGNAVIQTDGYPLCMDCDCKSTAIDHICGAGDVSQANECPDIVEQTTCMPDPFENLFNSFNVVALGAGCGDTDLTDLTSVSIVKDELEPKFIADCSGLDSNSGAETNYMGMPIYWVESGGSCTLGANQQIGSYTQPVILVTEAGFSMTSNNSSVFGIVLVLHDCYNGTGGYYSTCPTSAPTIQGTGGKIYGSLIASKDVTLPAGNITLIWAKNVINAVTNNGKGWPGLGRIGGTWRDYE